MSFLRNKYLLTLLAFGVWMLFFDTDDLLSQQRRRSELQKLRESKAYFVDEISRERKFTEDLKTDPAVIEAYAREKYGMKRDGEEVFLIQPPDSTATATDATQ